MENSLKNYFLTTDMDNRESILKKISAYGMTDQESIRILNYLWKLRYNRKVKRTIIKDAFLDSVLQLLSIDNMLKSGIGWKKLQRQVFETAETLGLNDYIFQTEKGAELFVKEYENLARYFVELGKNDRVYRSGTLRLKQLESGQLFEKIKRDFRIISVKIPDEFGFSNVFVPLKKGFDNCIFDYMKEMTVDAVKG